MSRTYWALRPDNSYEFLGAFADGHVARPNTPQGEGRVLDVTDKGMREVEVILDLANRPSPPRLAGLPSALAKRWQARMPLVLPWAQVEGFVK